MIWSRASSPGWFVRDEGEKKVSADKKDLRLLTQQEKKVLKLVVKAQSNKEIAQALRISPSTVKRHLENILQKLHLRNRTEAAVHAVMVGISSGKAEAP
jgi:DNA-binding NarL/FixJ family response regulator